MTDNTQPEALRLATASNAMADEGEMIHLLSWHEIRNLLRANAAELRRQHTRIAELEARIKTMAEEHADELMVAHLDGRMRAAQPAGAQQPGAAYAELPDAPLSVFSKGPWTFKETGQNFSGAELDEAAFVAYRDRASHGQAPAQPVAEPAQVSAVESNTVGAVLSNKGLTPELAAALQRGADGVFDLLKDWHLINKDAKAGRRLWQIGRNLEGIFGCALRGDYTRASSAPAQPAPQQEAQEPCPSCRNSDIYACTCTFPKSRNTAPQPSPASQGDALDAAKHCLEMGESFRALRRVVNLLLEARRNLGPEDHELRDRIDRLLRDDAARAAQEGK